MTVTCMQAILQTRQGGTGHGETWVSQMHRRRCSAVFSNLMWFTPAIRRSASSVAATASFALVKITALLTNPTSNENQNETATLTNGGRASISLVGWKLRDLAGNT
jgi:hypothetical protein